tara:strand:- start:92 stop:370 length:279 start_codon:yes stop_codon:yes gene_type:complete
MSLNSFFDTIDTDAQFDAWKTSIKQKLINLKNIIPIENRQELYYVGETLEFINSLSILSTEFLAKNPNAQSKTHLRERLKVCNSYYEKFGKR